MSRMTTREAFRTNARELGVSDESIDQILHRLHPAYALDSEGKWVGWLGGTPALPPGVTWDGDPAFVASIDLGALPPHSLDTGLPRDGQLLLFADDVIMSALMEDGPPDFPQALYVPAGTEMTPWDESAAGEDYDEAEVIERRPLYAKTVWDCEGDGYDDEIPEEAIREYRSLAGHLDPLLLGVDGADLKLGGLAEAQQNPVAEDLVRRIRKRKARRADGGRAPHPREYELCLPTDEEEAAAWAPLVQANQSGVFDQGDGAFYWAIPRVDLAQSRFDRTEVMFQC